VLSDRVRTFALGLFWLGVARWRGYSAIAIGQPGSGATGRRATASGRTISKTWQAPRRGPAKSACARTCRRVRAPGRRAGRSKEAERVASRCGAPKTESGGRPGRSPLRPLAEQPGLARRRPRRSDYIISARASAAHGRRIATRPPRQREWQEPRVVASWAHPNGPAWQARRLSHCAIA
jgi:hypothetical protein